MSGFVAIFQRDGAQPEPRLLDELTASLRFRGPDGSGRWLDRHVGLGFAWLRAGAAGTEPLETLDERYALVGDIRLDGRAELRSALRAAGCVNAEGLPDERLVLEAFRAWGDGYLQRLHGDFSFALWDAQSRQLRCVRDRFGVKPLFYAALGDGVIVSNTLQTLLRHPRLDQALDDAATADFLQAGSFLDPAATIFRSVRRLPRSHRLDVTMDAVRVGQYWALPEDSELRYRDEAQYVEHYQQLLDRAVRDRLAAGPAGLYLSGGIDSGSIAAAAAGRFSAPPQGVSLRAFCTGWNSAFEDAEPSFAAMTASALDIPLEVDELPNADPTFGAGRVASEPDANPFAEFARRGLEHAASHARVALDGKGGDELFYPEFVLPELLRAPSLALLAGIVRAGINGGQRPGLGLRALSRRDAPDPVPDWLDTHWSRSLGLGGRLHSIAADRGRASRPTARILLGSPMWGTYVETYDPGITGVCLDVRLPLLDERLVAFALRLPPFPWCVGKRLPRRALAGVLPEAITNRRKAGLPRDPLVQWFSRSAGLGSSFAWAADLLRDRVDPQKWGAALDRPGAANSVAIWQLARSISFAFWLQSSAVR